MAEDREWRVRHAAFQWLVDLGAPQAELTRDRLATGFQLDGVRVPLLGPQGIWSPAGFNVPLSIATIPSGPYSDHLDPATNRLRYAYRGVDPQHRDNVALRRAIQRQTPLIHFFRTDPGYYVATFPVYVVGDDPVGLMFTILVDEPWVVRTSSQTQTPVEEPLRREYATRLVRQRLFQAEFRRRVVDAYRVRCALCSLRHRELLDAAHITADAEASGDPVVSNGMALCKLHHAAFDQFFFAVTPDYKVVVRESILTESDGPMLVVGLQQIHGTTIHLPASAEHRPDRERLAARLERFLRAS